MGFKNGNGVLTAKRILITSPIEPSSRVVVSGKLKEISKDDFRIVSQKSKKETVFSVTSKTKTESQIDAKITQIKPADIKKDDRIVVAGSPNEKNKEILSARTLRVFQTASPSSSPTLTPKPTSKSSSTSTPKSSPTPT